jgi:hypothetical protein
LAINPHFDLMQVHLARSALADIYTQMKD